MNCEKKLPELGTSHGKTRGVKFLITALTDPCVYVNRNYLSVCLHTLPEQDLADGQGGGPVVLEDVQTDVALAGGWYWHILVYCRIC